MNPRLHPQTIAILPANVIRPAYDRTRHGIGIVHLGLGAFHRAHQAVYVDDVLARFGGDWRILGVSLRSDAVRNQLQPQECLFTLDERGRDERRLRVIGSIADALVAPERPQAVLDALARPFTHLISLTITEKGYCREAASGHLDRTHADIVHDLANPHAPRSAIGFVAEALRRRWRRSVAAPTLLSCDNLPNNGATLKRVLLEYTTGIEPALAEWIDREVACPATMVDRVVPATTPEDIEQASAALGVRDEALVKAEPFSQWVIEDRFAGARPPLGAVGATLVADVRPFEIAKLRLLNGSHSALAYLGSLAGFRFVHQAIEDADFGAFIVYLMRSELAPTLDPVPSLDLAAYRVALLNRFANPALAHRLLQIAMDGSQKLPQRLLEPAAIRLRSDQSMQGIALVVAAWMRFATGRGENGGTHAVDDPLASRFLAIADEHGRDASSLVGAFLGVREIFPRELAEHGAFRAAVLRHLVSLLDRGAGATVHEFVQQLEAQERAVT